MGSIVIVDSQAETRQQLVALLEQAGHRVTAVATISGASALIKDEAPDLLATDAVLIDGSSETLTEQAAAAGAQILVMTGNADRIVGLDDAGRPYLSKPFTPEAFLERVQEILGPEGEIRERPPTPRSWGDHLSGMLGLPEIPLAGPGSGIISGTPPAPASCSSTSAKWPGHDGHRRLFTARAVWLPDRAPTPWTDVERGAPVGCIQHQQSATGAHH